MEQKSQKLRRLKTIEYLDENNMSNLEVNSKFYGRLLGNQEIFVKGCYVRVKQENIGEMVEEKDGEDNRQDLSSGVRGDELVVQIKSEYDLLLKLDHKNILKPIELVETRGGREDEKLVYFKVQYLDQDLYKYYQTQFPSVDHQRLKQIFYQIGESLNYLHKQHGRAHLDIKSENIGISHDNIAYLLDFEHSLPYQDINSLNIRELINNKNLSNIPPELFTYFKKIQQGPYNISNINWEALDIFSLGITMFSGFFYAQPIQSGKASKRDPIYQHIFNKNYEQFWNSSPQILYYRNLHHKQFPDTYLQLENLIISMIHYHPSDRITIQQFLESPFFKESP